MLSKHYLLALNSDDPDEYLEPGDVRHKLNLIPKNEGSTETPSQETLKGNTATSITLPDPSSQTLGSCVDEANNRVIFFNRSPLSEHQIWMYDARVGTNTLIYQDSVLGFWYNGYVKARIIDDNLMFVDGQNNIRMINITDAIAGKYTSDVDNPLTELTDDQKDSVTSLYKTAPSYAPTWSKTNTGDTDFNQVSDYNFQFAYRYVYMDDTMSHLSEISDLIPAQKKPFSFKDTETYYNTIRLNVYFEKGLQNIIDKIDICYRIGNYGQWKVYDSVETTGYNTASIDSAYNTVQIDFKNEKAGESISDQEALKPYEAIPRISDSLELIENRLFAVEDKVGFDIDDDAVSLTPQTNLISDFGTNDLHSKYFKEHGLYNIGVQYFDKPGRNSAIKSVVSYEIDGINASNYTVIAGTRPQVKVTVQGTVPAWVDKWRLVRTQDGRHDVYTQFVGKLFYYVSEYNPEDPPTGWPAGDITDYDPFVMNDRVYRQSVPTSTSDKFNYLHIQIPNNLPIVIDKSYLLRFKRNYASLGITDTFRIIDVIGDVLVVEDLSPSGGDYDNEFPNQTVFLEAFKLKQEPDDIFYACSPLYRLDGTNDISTTVNTLWGDTYVILANENKTRFTFNNIEYEDRSEVLDYEASFLTEPMDYRVESPTPSFTSKSIETAIEVEAKRNENRLGFKALLEGPSAYLFDRQFNHQGGFVLDYTKDDEGIGRPSVINKKEEERTNTSVIRFSRQYVADSNINGLGTFDAQDKYVLNPERGPIKALIRADEVLLAIHPRTITAMYMGESFIKTADGQDILTRTENLIGQDRPLGGNLGSIFPESIVSHTYVDPQTNAKSTRVYGFDIYAGEPWRASNNGVIGLAARYKMRKWFKEKSEQLIPYIESTKFRIVSGYHPYWDMYLITFPYVPQANSEAITVGFSEKLKRWVSFYSFAPDHYQHIDNRLISFKGGIPYLHDTNSSYNNFYGTSYNSEATFVCNANYSKDKVFRSIAQESSEAIYIPSMTTPTGQDTYLRTTDFKKKGDNYFANLWRDKNSYVQGGQTPMVHGKEMAGKSLEVKLEITAVPAIPMGLVQIQSVNVGFIEVSGNLNV